MAFTSPRMDFKSTSVWRGTVNGIVAALLFTLVAPFTTSLPTATASGDGLLAYFRNDSTATNLIATSNAFPFTTGTCNTSTLTTIDFSTAPAGCNSTNLTSFLTGWILAPTTGSVTFKAYADDGVFIKIGATAVLSGTTDNNGSVPSTGSINLVQGQVYPINIWHHQNQGGLKLNLKWEWSGQSEVTVPQSNLGTTAAALLSSSQQTDNCKIGYSEECPAYSPQEIQNLYGTSTDTAANGTYWLLIGGVARAVYVLMDSNVDGGGYVLLMKGANNATTFNYRATYWTDNNTFLNDNSSYLRRNDGSVNEDAKFLPYEQMATSSLLAVFPELTQTYEGFTYTGPSNSTVFQRYGFYWNESISSYITPASGHSAQTLFSANTNRTETLENGTNVTVQRILVRRPSSAQYGERSGAATRSFFSTQTNVNWYGFNYRRKQWDGAATNHPIQVRWGFGWNENGSANEDSNDASGGIGYYDDATWSHTQYSAGDFVGCCVNRTGVSNFSSGNASKGLKFEIYGKMPAPSASPARSLVATPASPTSVNLSWTAPVSGTATEYVIQYKTTSQNWSDATTRRLLDPGNSPSTVITGLTTDVTYNFRVWNRQYTNARVLTTSSSSTDANATTQQLNAPTINSVTATSTTQLSIDFSAPVNPGNAITGYQVDYSTDGSTWTTASSSVASNATSYTISGLTAGTEYFVRVAAKHSAGLGAWGYPWRKIYETRTPSRSSNLIVYESGFGLEANDAAAQNASTPFTRVRYEMRATYSDGVNDNAKYVLADFARSLGTATANSSSISVPTLRVPTTGGDAANKFEIHANVNDLTILSNVADVQNGNGFTGRLEIWPWDYQIAPTSPLTARSSSLYDDADSYVRNSGSYGSFQLHRIGSVNKTVFAWNAHFNSNPDIGFGNYSGTHSDWTFAYEAAGYAGTRSNFQLSTYINAPTSTLANYTITFAAGTNGTGSNQTLTKTQGTALTLPNSATANSWFTRAGYTVSGWSTTNGGSQNYALGSSYTNDSAITLYPVWTANTLTVTYDSRGGTAVASGSVSTGGSIASAPTAPTRTGYTFLGWFTATTGGSAISFPYSPPNTSNFTLYAQWSANNLTITFNSNFGTATTTTQSITADQATNLTANSFVRPGYKFAGWSTNDDGTGTSYTNSQNVTLLESDILYAKWERTAYPIYFNQNFGANTVTSDVFYSGGTIVLPTVSRAGYNLVAWATAASNGTLVGAPGATYSPLWATDLVLRYEIDNENSYSGTGNNVLDIAHLSNTNLTAAGAITGLIGRDSGNNPNYSMNDGGYLDLNTANGHRIVTQQSLTTRVGAGNQISVFTWIYPEALNGVIVSELGQTAINNFWHDSQIEMVNGKLNFNVWANGYNTPHTQTTNTITLNKWYYAGFTYNGTTFTAYVFDDTGSLVSLSNNNKTLTRTAPANLHYGIGATDSTSLGSGVYGDFRFGSFHVYKSGLSSSVVTNNYQATCERFHPDAAGCTGQTLYAQWGQGPIISLSASSLTTSFGSAISSYTITNTGGAATSYSISPSLPTGITLNTSTGVLTGTPTVISPETTYTLTATNSNGSNTATFTLKVVATLDLNARINGTSAGNWVDQVDGNPISTPGTANNTFPTWNATNKYFSFDGTNHIYKNATYTNPSNFSIEVWFRTTQTGSKIIGFQSGIGNGTGAEISSYDRHLYVDTNGKLRFGLYNNASFQFVISDASVNDGNWHHAVATYTGTTAELYLDNVKKTTTVPSSTQNYTGYWVIGGAKLTSWANSTNNPFVGDISLARIYPGVVSSSLVSNSYANLTGNQSVTLTLNSNYGTPTTQAEQRSFGVSAAITANPFSRTNYTFAGWATEPTGAVVYADSANLTLNSDLTLYAIWTGDSYTVTYNYNNADGGNSDSTSTYTVGGNSISLPTPTKTGFTFGGWFDNSNLTGNAITSPYTPTGDITLYAKWTGNALTPTFGTPAATVDGFTVQISNYDNAFTFAATVTGSGSVVISGTGLITVTGLSANVSATVTVTTTRTGYSSGSATVTSAAISNYTVTFNYNGADGNNSTATAVFNIGGSGLTLPSPTKTGYTFAGWFEAADLSGTALSGAYSPSQDRTIYAKWTAKVCSITESTFVGTGSNGGQLNVSYRIFRFATVGDCVWTLPQGLTSLDVLVVAGGGGGGGAYDTGGAGGGAGGQVKQQTIDVSALSELVIVVGAGGSAGVGQRTSSPPEIRGGAGGSSELIANGVRIITALGGDGGSRSRVDYFVDTGIASGRSVGTGGAAATANTQPRGGAHGGNGASGTAGSGGGGGGSNGAGRNATSNVPGTGGAGTSVNLTGALVTYGSGGAGGDGGTPRAGVSAGVNTGNGGGGAGATSSDSKNGGTGGSGIVILRTQFVGTTYAVSFDTNGGNNIADTTFVSGGTVAEPTPPIRAGYTFAGWYAAANLSGSALTFPYAPGVTSAITLYAKWTANSVSVTFYKNDGTADSASQNLTADTATALTANSFTRSGYDFAGWNTLADGTGANYSDNQNVTLITSLVLYAKWTPKTLTVTFNKNDGGNTSTTQSITAATATNLTANTFTRSGYVFSGWNTNSGGTGTSYGDAVTVTLLENLTLHAKWTAVSYTVTYNLNSGSGTVPTETNKNIGNSFQLANSTGLSRNGYTFGGWSDGTNTYQASANYTMPAANVALIAVWNIDTYTITYSANNGTGSATRTTDTYQYGSPAIVLPGRGSLARTGYTFAGWATTSGGSAIVGNYTPQQSITLYAVWSANTYTITYNSNGATGSPTAATESYTTGTGGSNLTTVGSMVKVGHLFNGWSLTANGAAVQTPYSPTENVTLYAVWTQRSYTITYDLNDGNSARPTEANKFYNQTFTLASAATRAPSAGVTWAFVAWSDGTNQYQPGETYRMPAASVTLTAQWIAIFTVKYTMNGADTAAPADEPKADGESVVLAAAPTRTGYTFAGWVNQSNTSFAAGATMPININSYLVYATWTAISYNLTYSAAGGSNAPAGGTFTIGTEITVGSAPTRAGYRFNGWSYNSNLYGAGAKIIAGAANIALTASWTAIDYTISYDLNGSAGNRPDDFTANIGETFQTAIAPTKPGYTFAGWSDGSTTLAAGATYTVGSSNVNLTASWTAINYTLSYDVNGGNSSAPTGANNLTIGSTFTVAAAPTHQNRTFLGWSDGTNTYTAGQTYTVGSSNITLSAVWSGVNYNITYDLNGGSGTAPIEAAKQANETFTVKGNSGFARANHTFAGWKIGADPAAENDQITVGSAPVTLVAQWTPAFTVAFGANGGTATADLTFTGTALERPANPTRTGFVFNGWTNNGNPVSWPYSPTGPVNLTAQWIQASLYGISPSALTRFGSLNAATGVAGRFSGSNANSSVTVDVPAGALPNNTAINIDLVSDTTRARNLISNENSYLVSFVVSWLAADGTVPTTAAGKPILMTITNSEIKAGATIYSVVGETYTILGRATQDGTVTIEITEDPEILVAATRPDAPTNVTATSGAATNLTASWIAPVNNGGSVIINYTATTNTGQSCTTTTLSCTINGLTASTSYTVTVIATNGVGNSVASVASESVTTAAAQNNGGGGGGGGNNNGGGNNSGGGSGNSGGGSGNSGGGSTPVKETPTKPVLVTNDGKPTTAPVGVGKRIVDGVVKTELIRVIEKQIVRTEFSNVAIEVKAVATNNAIKDLKDNTTLVFEQAGKASLSGAGFKPVTTVKVWIFSEPTYLGEAEVKSDGSFDMALLIPANFPAGEHTLQINGVTNSNEIVTQTFGVVVEEVKPTPEPEVKKPVKKLVLNLAMTKSQIKPTKAQLAKTKKLAKSVVPGAVITCKSFVTNKPATKAQITQASKIAASLCAPLVKNSEVKVKFNKVAPRNASSLPSAKTKPVRVQVLVKAISS